MGETTAAIEEHLKDAHLPALLCAMVHMTGETDWLKAEWTPVYNPLSRGDTGIPEDEQAKIRARAAVAIKAFLDGKPMALASPSVDVLRRQMDFVAGAPIPEMYVDFLVDELALKGESTKDPKSEHHLPRDGARRLKVLVVGAGMSGLLTGIRLAEAGVPFDDILLVR